MSNIRDLIAKPVEVKEIVVDGHIIRGKPDAGILGRTALLPESDRIAKARHWERMGIGVFDADIAGKILMVHAVLVTPEGADPYDEIEIAQLAAGHGPLFLQLLGAAIQVLGFTDEKGQDNSDLVLETGLGNLPETASDSGSSSGASKGRENIRTRS